MDGLNKNKAFYNCGNKSSFAQETSHNDCYFTVKCLFAERDPGKLKYDHDRVERSECADGYTPAALVSTAATSHFPVPTLSSTITVIAPTHHHSNNTTDSWSGFRPDHPVDRGPFRGPPPQPRKRCRDYDGKESNLNLFN